MYSKEHYSYLNKRKKEKKIIIISQIGIIFLFLILWQLLADFKIINTFITSSPKNILITLKSLIINESLFININVTLYETLLSFILSMLISLIIASVLWWNRIIAKIIEPYLTILNSLPKVALGPIIIIWAGANINSIILMALLISIFITTINLYQAFINTNILKINLMKTFNATKKQIFFKLIIPLNKSNIISTLKINLSMCFIGVIMGELLVSKNGLGYLIMYGSQVFNINLIICSIIILCILASILYYLIVYIEKKVI